MLPQRFKMKVPQNQNSLPLKSLKGTPKTGLASQALPYKGSSQKWAELRTRALLSYWA